MVQKLTAALKQFIVPGEPRRRVLMTICGILLSGFCVSLCRMANFGVDPFQCLCSGIYLHTPISQGTTYTIINAVLLIAVLIYNRHYVNLGTLINMFLLGYVCDGGEQLLRSLFPVVTLPGQIVFLVIALVLLCFASAMYITADYGVSTYDAIALHLTAKKLGPYRIIRIITDLICVGIGFALGYTPGVATIITALCMGPLTSFFKEHVTDGMRAGRKKAV